MKAASFYVLSLILASSFAVRQLNGWRISEDYVIKFSGSGVEGTFRKLSGVIQFDPEDLKRSRFDVTVDVNTISTGNKTKDRHARGKSWLDAERYPMIRFTSSYIARREEGYVVMGTLELHGVKKEVNMPFTFSKNGYNGIFEGTLTVDRQEFGIEGPFLGFMVGDEFDITLKVPVAQ